VPRLPYHKRLRKRKKKKEKRKKGREGMRNTVDEA